MRERTHRATSGVLLLALAVGAGGIWPAQAAAQSGSRAGATGVMQDAANELSLSVGKSVLIDFAQPVTRVAVGVGDYAEASAITPTEIMVNGKAPGETSMIVWDVRGGRQFFNVVVRANEAAVNKLLEGVRREIRNELPGQSIKVSEENGSYFLRGAVKDMTSATRAVQIAQSAGKVVNLLQVETPEAEPQILLKVRFAAVDRSKERDLGANFISNGIGNTPGVISTGQFTSPSITNSGGTSVMSITDDLNLMAFPIGNAQIGVTIKALEQKGLAEILAEPNLMATNGKQASFLAGGEYPYPMMTGSGSNASISIMFKEYGVRLNFIPTITPRNTIKLQVAPEVSSLDSAHSVTISGFTVPAIVTRKVNTQVELSDGQSFILGGLLSNEEQETFSKIPLLGDIPVLGKLFQSIARTHKNSELIVIVTPEIVSPMPVGAPIPELKYPQKFLSQNSDTPMHTPDAKTPANTLKPTPKMIPVEKLVESLKAERPLQTDSSSSPSGASTPSGAGASATNP